MKTRMLPGLAGISALAVVFLTSLAQAQTTPPLATTPSSPPAQAATPAVDPAKAPNAVSGTSVSPAPQAKVEQPAPARPRDRVALSYWAREMVKLAGAGIEESVQYSFIDNAAGTFNLGAEQIIYLRDAGISSDIISAMLQHDFEIAEGLRSIPVMVTPPSDFTLEFLPAKSVPSNKPQPAALRSSPSKPEPARAGPDADEPAEDWLLAGDLELAILEAEQFQETARQERQATYSIRKPHPVRISPPIIIFRATGVTPNVQLLKTEL